MSKILVTGGAGYIGSHACKALADAGYEPVTFDNLSTGWRDAVQFGPFEEGDLLDAPRISEVVAKHKPLAVMHFASLAEVGESMQDPALYWNNNVLGSLNLLQAVADNKTPHFIFSSTCATYGDHDGVMLDENTPQHPINAYGASKLAIEHMLENFSDRYGFNHVIFRYFNVAGAEQSGMIGEFHDPETHLIPLAIEAAMGKRPALTIYGDDYPTQDGTCVRDYVHVNDLVDAHVKGLSYLLSGNPSEAFNLGSGRGFSVREVLDVVQGASKTPMPTNIGPRRAGDSASLVSGSQKAADILNWSPKQSNLSQMINDAMRWHAGKGYSS